MTTSITSKSPFGECFELVIDEQREEERLKQVAEATTRPMVVIQGLGFVGAAMCAAVASAERHSGQPRFHVVGVDLADQRNAWKIARVNEGLSPVISTDEQMVKAYAKAHEQRNLTATYLEQVYEIADVVVVDVNLDIHKSGLGKVDDYRFGYDAYERALTSVALRTKEDCLILIETTVPPGTTEKVVKPLFERIYRQRGLDPSKLLLAHSYERVMPGPDYLNSVTNYYRVFSGVNEASTVAARQFLESFINTADFPLQELHSTNASEMSKVLENTFRATNIALIREWTEFAHAAKVNLFEVIEAIRVRPTHKNIMAPGFGVGGYCLTKDALLADYAYKSHFGGEATLNMSLNAIAVNDVMPETTMKLLEPWLSDVATPKLALLGISYLNDVSDTRYTPAYYFTDLAEKEGCTVIHHDPLVEYWEERNSSVHTDLRHESFESCQVVVLAVRHRQYLDLSADDIRRAFPALQILVDANNIISDEIARNLHEDDVRVLGVGKGHWLAW